MAPRTQSELKRSWLRVIDALPTPDRQEQSSASGSSSAPASPSTQPSQPALSIESVRATLDLIEDDLWVAAACEATLSRADDVSVQRELIRIGLARTDAAAAACTSVLADGATQVSEWISANEQYAKLLGLRASLLRMARMLDAFETIYLSGQVQSTSNEAQTEKEDDPWEENENEDDPWAEPATSSGASGTADRSAANAPASSRTPTQASSASFLSTPLAYHARCFTLAGHIHALRLLLCAHHSHARTLFGQRLALLETLLGAGRARPREVGKEELLPGVGEDGKESGIWVTLALQEADAGAEIIDRSDVAGALDTWSGSATFQPFSHHAESAGEPLSSSSLSDWYSSLAQTLESTYGALDDALSLVQHGSSVGVSNLEPLGEELSLLSRLVYEAPSPPSSELESSGNSQWNLKSFRKAAPNSLALAYVHHSAPASIANDVKRLVLPYLYVLASRAERAGDADWAELVPRALSQLVLDISALPPPRAGGESTDGLALVAALFDASKPTLASSARLVSSDEELARLALAVLYGSSRTDAEAWDAMARAFECLPAFNNASPASPAPRADVATKLRELVQSTSTRAPAGPDILHDQVFRELDAGALSPLLDALDVHLEGASILSRWGAAVPLRWFLTSCGDSAEQRRCATRLTRTRAAAETWSEREWRDLLVDMVKLAGDGDADAEGAWAMLGKDEVLRIFFGGVLSTGDFALFRALLAPDPSSTTLVPALDEHEAEQLVLAASREFFDNAQSANLHRGDMKMAYECLTAVASTPAIQRERAFIEASSRLCSFNISSRLRPGVPIAPIEIRLATDKLDLIARLLAHNEDAYTHPDLILDLARKLTGAVTDPPDPAAVEIRTLAMLADAAVQATNFPAAARTCERLVAAIAAMPKRAQFKRAQHTDIKGASAVLSEAREVGWATCYQLAKQPEYGDTQTKLTLMGHALSLCPPDKISDFLIQWRDFDETNSREVESGKQSGADGFASPFSALFASTGLTGSATRKPSALLSALPGSARPTDGSAATAANTPAPSGGFGRAAHLFDRFGDAATLDPAERAARAARSLFAATGLGGGGGAGEGGQGGAGAGGGTRSASGFSLSRGMGWLIGEHEQT